MTPTTLNAHPNLQSRFSRYVVSLFVAAFSLLLRGMLDPVIGDYVPYLAVLPAVVFAAWFCGLGPSLVVMVLAFLGEQYWFVTPQHSLKIVGTAEQAGAIVYFAVSLTIIVFADNNRRVIDKLAVSRAELQQASDELARSHNELEQRVVERTRQLQEKNKELLTQAAVVRQLSGRLLQMQDEERRRIARELHDSVGQLVAAMGMNLTRVQRENAQLSPKAAEALTENAALTKELSRQIRTISHLLHPPLLDEVGLGSAIEWFVEGFAKRSQIDVGLELPREIGRLPRELETAIFRVVQECLTNVHRHSGSRTAAVRITNVSNELRVEVEDAGKGIPSGMQEGMCDNGRPGIGMSGMRAAPPAIWRAAGNNLCNRTHGRRGHRAYSIHVICYELLQNLDPPAKLARLVLSYYCCPAKTPSQFAAAGTPEQRTRSRMAHRNCQKT